MNFTAITTHRSYSDGNDFVFSSEGFDRCFKTNSDFFKRYDYISINNHIRGDFHFMGTDFVRTRRRQQCIIKVTVPSNRFILLELLDLVLPCSSGAVRIYTFKDNRPDEMAAEFCEQVDGDRQDSRLILPFNIGFLKLTLRGISPTYVMRLRFSAISQSEGHLLQHIAVNKRKGCAFVFIRLMN